VRPESQPVRGRLVDLEGNALPNVKVSVESLDQPSIAALLNAFEKSWKQGVYDALNVTSWGMGGIARTELQKLIPAVKTNQNGEFELRGIGDDQLASLVLDADGVAAGPVNVLGRKMKTVTTKPIPTVLKTCS